MSKDGDIVGFRKGNLTCWGPDMQREREREAGACKCGAGTLEAHSALVREGYPAHVYTGFAWLPVEFSVNSGTEDPGGE